MLKHTPYSVKSQSSGLTRLTNTSIFFKILFLVTMFQNHFILILISTKELLKKITPKEKILLLLLLIIAVTKTNIVLKENHIFHSIQISDLQRYG